LFLVWPHLRGCEKKPDLLRPADFSQPLSPHDPLIDSAAERHGDRTGLAFRKSRFWQTNMEKI
jgi:hypothetical protein